MEVLMLFLLVPFTIFLAVVVFKFYKKNKLLQKVSDDYQARFRHKEQQYQEIEKEVESLAKYRKVADADKAAQEYVAKAKQFAAKTINEAKEQAATTASEAATEKSEARAEAKQIRERAQEQVDKATRQAEAIIETARTQAEEIAGDAMKAKGKADLFESAAKAARNIIKGYGDEYIVPNTSVLDDLAEDFSHKEAGQKLKEARQHTKTLIKQLMAADCEYADVHRRETAIQFVLDAYNGKVDSALTKVKHDNLGKIEQQLEDAFSLVNYNGTAFRNAHITDAYHKSRLEELRWAVAAYELRQIELEEQREIREQMREEERARREFEKARKDAEKEERMLQRAMEEARKHLADANEQERQAYQDELEALQAKLAEAEAKNERALSMAQQTRAGHVYVISNIGSFGDEVFKVGMTRRLEPLDRVKELSDASVPFEFDVHAMVYSDDAPTLEKELHRLFHYNRVNRVNPRKEFFKVSASEIRETLDNLGLETHFTMKAEAHEYYESVAIAKKETVEAEQPEALETATA